MSLLTVILLLILILLFFGGGYAGWGPAPRYPYANYPNVYLGGSLVWLILLIVILLLLTGYI